MWTLVSFMFSPSVLINNTAKNLDYCKKMFSEDRLNPFWASSFQLSASLQVSTDLLTRVAWMHCMVTLLNGQTGSSKSEVFSYTYRYFHTLSVNWKCSWHGLIRLWCKWYCEYRSCKWWQVLWAMYKPSPRLSHCSVVDHLNYKKEATDGLALMWEMFNWSDHYMRHPNPLGFSHYLFFLTSRAVCLCSQCHLLFQCMLCSMSECTFLVVVYTVFARSNDALD